MKSLRVLILTLSLFSSHHLMANEVLATAGFVTGTIGVVSGFSYQVGRAYWPKELEDWQNPQSGAAVDFADSCDLLAEVRLVRQSRYNSIFLAVQNHRDNSVILPLDEIQLQFSNGRERRVLLGTAQKQLEVRSRWYTMGALPLPRKKDFKGQEWLRVSIPVRNEKGEDICEITTEFRRNTEAPESEKSYSETSVFDVSLELGTSFRTGRLGDLTDSDSDGVFSVNLYAFSSSHHGVYLGFDFEGYEDLLANSVANTSVANFSDPNLVGFVSALGYVYRRTYKDRHSLYLSVAPSYYSLQFNESGSSADSDTFGSWSFSSRISYDYKFSRVASGFWVGDWSAGITVSDHYVLPRHSDSLAIGGHSVGVLARLRLGY